MSERAPIFLSPSLPFPSLPTVVHPSFLPPGRLALASSVTLLQRQTDAQCLMQDHFFSPSSPRTLTIHASSRPHSCFRLSCYFPCLSHHSQDVNARCCIKRKANHTYQRLVCFKGKKNKNGYTQPTAQHPLCSLIDRARCYAVCSLLVSFVNC